MKSEQPVFDRVLPRRHKHSCEPVSDEITQMKRRVDKRRWARKRGGEVEDLPSGGGISVRSNLHNQISRQLRLCFRPWRADPRFRRSCSVKYSDIWQNVFDNGLYNWVLDVDEWFDSVCYFMLTTTEWFLICAPSSLDLSPWTIRKFDF